MRDAGASPCAIPVRLDGFGYVRSWCFRSSTGFTALGLRLAEAGEADKVNGVVFEAGQDLVSLDRREFGYTRVKIPRHSVTVLPCDTTLTDDDDDGVLHRLLTEATEGMDTAANASEVAGPSEEESGAGRSARPVVNLWTYVPMAESLGDI